MILNNGKKRIPIGYEDFKQVIDGGFYYVDKTMLIYVLLHNGGQNNLITRPRRFGKTLNFSMLKYFFDITEKENSYLFDGLKISEHYDELAVYKWLKANGYRFSFVFSLAFWEYTNFMKAECCWELFTFAQAVFSVLA